MAVQQRKPAFALKAKTGAGAIRKEIYCFYDCDPTLQTAFDSYNLRCKAIKDLQGMRFGALCMQIFDRYRKGDGNGPLGIYKPKKIMARAVREMCGAVFSEYGREMQSMRFLLHASGEIAELVRNGRLDEHRERILGYMSNKGNDLGRMRAFSEEERMRIRNSLDEDFFSKIKK